MVNEAIVRLMTQRIVDRFAPLRVIVFGSWAKDQMTSDSDIDFLVVMPYSGSKRDLQVSIRRELKDFDIPKDVLVVSPDELHLKQNQNGFIYQSAIAEGKVLYEC